MNLKSIVSSFFLNVFLHIFFSEVIKFRKYSVTPIFFKYQTAAIFSIPKCISNNVISVTLLQFTIQIIHIYYLFSIRKTKGKRKETETIIKKKNILSFDNIDVNVTCNVIIYTMCIHIVQSASNVYNEHQCKRNCIKMENRRIKEINCYKNM